MACLVAIMQQMEEQYSLPQVESREPTHWIQAMRLASRPSDRRMTWPSKGPAAESIRSNWTLVTTFG